MNFNRLVLPAIVIQLALRTASALEPGAVTNTPGDFDRSPATPKAPAARVIAHSARDDGDRWTPTDFSRANPKLPTLFIAGDSTASTGDPAHRGWGAPLIDYFDADKINVINRARGGRSFRSFYGEGLWQQVVDVLRPGDFVVIEFGHNDGGVVTNGSGRGDLPGIGEETRVVTKPNGTSETVHTYGWYTRQFIREAKAKGATPIVSSTTVRNIWKNGKVERGMGQMLEWARQVAAEEKVPFVDHSNSTADLYEKAGQTEVAKYFPADHTHTSTDGAVVNAETFIATLKTLPDLKLVEFLNARGKAIAAWQPAAGK